MSEKRPVDRGPREPPPKRVVERAPASIKLRKKSTLMTRGDVIADRYEIGAKIGSGGMGVVHSAVEIATGREVAIKALSAGTFTTENLRRFRREARTAASVKHRHLCEVHYLGVAEGTPFIVMERLHGETLRRRLTAIGPTSASDAVTILLQLLEGLSAAHQAGVLHRDIKPANIFITTPRGDVPFIKVIDFGLAKLIPTTAWKPRPGAPPEELSAITTTNVVPGTPFYLAPEQIAGARDLDGRVDVWAAGLLFYEMLSGQRAYDAPSYATLVTSILMRRLPALESFRDDLPPGFETVLGNAVAKDRNERFPSALAFRKALIDEWARFRTAGVVRGEQLRKYRPPAVTVPMAEEDDGAGEMTDVNVHVEYDPGD